MPVMRVTKGGRPGYRWGKTGKVYTYRPGNEAARKRAKTLATRQGDVIQRRMKQDREKLRIDIEASFQPDKQAAVYESKLHRRNLARHSSVSKVVDKAIRKIPKTRADAEVEKVVRSTEDEFFIFMSSSLAKAARDWAGRKTISQVFLAQIGRSTEAHSRRQTTKILLGTDPDRLRKMGSTAKAQRKKAIRAFIRENTKLIKTIDERYFDRLTTQLTDAYLGGSNGKKMRDIVRDSFGVSDSNAERIARDQTSKLNNLLSRQQMTYAGAEHYEWITSGDSRVRPSHVANNREIFAWVDPPAETGHPGNDVNCRCVAIAVFGGDSRLVEYKSPKANPTATAKGASDFLSGENV